MHEDNMVQALTLRTENQLIEQSFNVQMETSTELTNDLKNEITSLDTDTQMEFGSLLCYNILN